MKNKKYSIRKLSTGLISIIISIGTMKVGIVNAQMEIDNKVVINEKGVIPDVEPIPPENVIEEPIRKPPVKPTEKSIEKPPVKPTEKPTEKPPVKPIEKPTEKPPVKPIEKPTEKPPVKPIEKPTEKTTTNALETDSKVEIKNDVLVGNLSGREIKVSFKKGSVYAEKLYVEPLNDNDLNETIKHKLGSDYNIIETFEIHFEKNDKRVDSNVERTVTVAIVKKDNAELEVFHIADENTLEKVNSSYSTGELKFNINHFSKFTIVERIKIGSKDLEERTKIEIPEKIENKEKENNELPETKSIKDEKQLKILPKTGVSGNSSIFAGFILIIVASIIRKRKIINK
ncbi:YSIRK-type signal peptide-containing protein [Gemella sp.]